MATLGTERDFWNDWPEHLIQRMNEARQERLTRLAAIASPAQAQARIDMIRSKLWELLGATLEKQPLNPWVTGQIERKGYRIEKIVFESIPGVYVTANLYVPASGRAPFPAILAPVGHSQNGKAYHTYQYL
jgi:hypothetical protein